MVAEPGSGMIADPDFDISQFLPSVVVRHRDDRPKDPTRPQRCNHPNSDQESLPPSLVFRHRSDACFLRGFLFVAHGSKLRSAAFNGRQHFGNGSVPKGTNCGSLGSLEPICQVYFAPGYTAKSIGTRKEFAVLDRK